MIKYVIKRDGKKEIFSEQKIATSLSAAGKDCGGLAFQDAIKLAADITETLSSYTKGDTVSSEKLSDFIVEFLGEKNLTAVGRSFSVHRDRRTSTREKSSALMRIYGEKIANESTTNAERIFTDFARFGLRQYNDLFSTKPEYIRAQTIGDVHVHDKALMGVAPESAVIDLSLLIGGFTANNCTFEKLTTMDDFIVMTLCAVRAASGDCPGELAVTGFEVAAAQALKMTFATSYAEHFSTFIALKYKSDASLPTEPAPISLDDGYYTRETQFLHKPLGTKKTEEARKYARDKAFSDTERSAKKAFAAILGYINSSPEASRFSTVSINISNGKTKEEQLAVKYFLSELKKGLPGGKPVTKPEIFFATDPDNPSEILHDAIAAAKSVKCFNFVLEPNCLYTVSGTRIPCGTFGNMCTASVNLVRLALRAHKSIDRFFQSLDNAVALIRNQLIDRFELTAQKKSECFPFFTASGLWNTNGTIRNTAEKSTLSVGFFGLAEAVTALVGFHHGDAKSSLDLALKIVSRIKSQTDTAVKETGLRFVLKGVSGLKRFEMTSADRVAYGDIAGVTSGYGYSDSCFVPSSSKFDSGTRAEINSKFYPYLNGGSVIAKAQTDDIAAELKKLKMFNCPAVTFIL